MIEIIAPVLVGGALALLGTFVGPFFQRKHEKWKAEREDAQLIRLKADQVFLELDCIRDQATSARIASVKRLVDENEPPVALPALGKVRLIVPIYFPTAQERLDAYDDESSRMGVDLKPQLELAFKDGDNKAIEKLSAEAIKAEYKRLISLVEEIKKEVLNNTPNIQ